MHDTIFTVSDPHGCLKRLNKLLTHWNPDNQQLVVQGDMIDRGKDSYGVVRRCMELKQAYGAVILGGNHEDLFIDWVYDPVIRAKTYYNGGGRDTLRSFFSGENAADRFLPEFLAQKVRDTFSDEVVFIESLPNYFESGDHVLVHAGVNLDRIDWKQSSQNEFRWIRRMFHYGKNDTGKIFVFGHEPTEYLNANKKNDIWFSPCKTKIGIDGGAVFGGQLNGLVIHPDHTYTAYSA